MKYAGLQGGGDDSQIGLLGTVKKVPGPDEKLCLGQDVHEAIVFLVFHPPLRAVAVPVSGSHSLWRRTSAKARQSGSKDGLGIPENLLLHFNFSTFLTNFFIPSQLLLKYCCRYSLLINLKVSSPEKASKFIRGDMYRPIALTMDSRYSPTSPFRPAPSPHRPLDWERSAAPYPHRRQLWKTL